MAVGLPLLMLLPLIVLGGLAAVVFGIVYAIVNKRPGVAMVAVLMPVVLLISIAFVGLGFGLRANVATRSAEPAQITWAADPSMPPMPPMPAARHIGPHPLSVDPDLAIWIVLAIALVAAVGVMWHFHKRANHSGERRGGGWGKALVVIVLIVLAAQFLTMRATYAPSRTAQHRVESPWTQKQRIHPDVTTAQRNAVESQHELEVVREQATNQQIDAASMQELWEKLNQPRIKLDADQHGASLSMGAGANQIAVMAPNEGGTNLVVPVSDTSPESLSRSLTRLERMVEQVSAVADRFSDAGTLIGKGMIALSDAAESRTRAKSADSATKSDSVDVVVSTAPAAKPAPAANVAVAVAESPIQQTIEVQFDQQKMNQFNLSYENIKDLLGRDGLWRGTAVRFVPNESRILVTGDLEDDYVSRLSGTLVSTVGRQRRPIHVSDVATISTSAERIARDATSREPANSARLAWIDEPPKNIGNVRRQVIVAGDFVTLEECNREADRQLYMVTLDHLKELCGDEDLDRIREFDTAAKSNRYGRTEPSPAEIAASTLNRMGIGIDFIRREIAKREYVETVERSVGPMKKLYVQVEFSPSIDLELRQRWDEVRRQDRFAVVGAGAGSVLGLLGLVFGLLKVDTWTKGYYTKRLFFGVPAAIIGLIALLMAAT